MSPEPSASRRVAAGIGLAVVAAVFGIFIGSEFFGSESSDTSDVAAETSTTTGLGSDGTSSGDAVATTTTTAPEWEPTEVYYVAEDGDDDAAGTEDDPWETIEHAESQAVDGSLILVKPGQYDGEIRLRGVFEEGIVIRSEVPYQARLRNDGQVIACYVCSGFTIEGFDMAHSGDEADRYVIQIQDAEGNGELGRRIVIRNNIIHDSRNNDLLKINNGAGDILVEGNLFYNQVGPDSHMDINSVDNVIVRNNVLFNDFGDDPLGTAAFIVIKDSNGDQDQHLGANDIDITGNVLFHWQGSSGAAYIAIGEDEVPYHQAHDVTVENNLLLGDSEDIIRAAFLAKGVNDVVFRNNTISGDLPSETYGIRLSLQDDNPPNEDVGIYNNIWSDPTGTMGIEAGESGKDFADAPSDETISHYLSGNLFWNGGADIPADPQEEINYTDDALAVTADPLLPDPSDITLPTWDEETGRFADGSSTIAEVFLSLVLNYGVPAAASPVVDAADPEHAPDVDILGNPRDVPDIGAVEVGGPTTAGR